MLKMHLSGRRNNFNGYTLLEGFPGYGLVGTIAVNFLVEKLNMEMIGFIESPLFPPVAAIHGGRPYPPLRLYKSDKHKLVVILSEFVMDRKVIKSVSDMVYDWCEQAGIKRIISLGGISIRGKQDEVFCISSDPNEEKMFEKMGITPIREGATTGMNALLLIRATTGGKIPVVSLLAEAKPDYVDPLGAAMVLTSLSDYIGLKVDTTELVREAMVIESKLRQAMDAAKKAEKAYAPATGHEPMYA